MEEEAAQGAGGWRVDETVRAAAIAAHDLDRLRDGEPLRRVTDFAAALCAAPVALVTLIEEERQSFLARTGTDLTETPRAVSFCAHTVLGDSLMVVPDLAADPRFAANPLVTGGPAVRFYAGAPLRTDDGVALGALCILDVVPRPAGLTPLQRQGLLTLAADVMARLGGNRSAAATRRDEDLARHRLADSEQRFRILADAMPQMVWSTLPDGYHDYYNARWYAFTGVPDGSTDGEGWNGMFHPDDQERAWATWRHSLATGEPYEIEYRLRYADGTYRWVLGRALPMRGVDGSIVRWFGTCTDIHEQKLASQEREVVSQELSHRIKNIFSVIAGLIGFAARRQPSFAPVADDLRRRITALGRAHDFVRPHSPRSQGSAAQDSLKGLLATLFQPYGRVVVEGADVAIDDRSTTPLALLFHELATNATKYGALSVPDGGVGLAIDRDADAVALTWREHGGPSIAAPPGQDGFGSQLIELSAVRQLGGTVERDWRPGGLVATVRVPLAAFSRAEAAATPAR